MASIAKYIACTAQIIAKIYHVLREYQLKPQIHIRKPKWKKVQIWELIWKFRCERFTVCAEIEWPLFFSRRTALSFALNSRNGRGFISIFWVYLSLIRSFICFGRSLFFWVYCHWPFQIQSISRQSAEWTNEISTNENSHTHTLPETEIDQSFGEKAFVHLQINHAQCMEFNYQPGKWNKKNRSWCWAKQSVHQRNEKSGPRNDRHEETDKS